MVNDFTATETEARYVEAFKRFLRKEHRNREEYLAEANLIKERAEDDGISHDRLSELCWVAISG